MSEAALGRHTADGMCSTKPFSVRLWCGVLCEWLRCTVMPYKIVCTDIFENVAATELLSILEKAARVSSGWTGIRNALFRNKGSLKKIFPLGSRSFAQLTGVWGYSIL